MTWTKVHLESMNILQLRELKKNLDDVIEKKIETVSYKHLTLTTTN